MMTPTWNKLRSTGNSPLVKASAIFPWVGYFILLNSTVKDFLSTHGLETHSASIVWWSPLWENRIYFLYFGLMSLGLGSMLYQWKCPSTIKKHADWIDYITVDGDALSYAYLEKLGERFGIPYDQTLGPDYASSLGSDIMQAHYEFETKTYLAARAFVSAFFWLGFFLLAIPSLISAFRVIQQLAST